MNEYPKIYFNKKKYYLTKKISFKDIGHSIEYNHYILNEEDINLWIEENKFYFFLHYKKYFFQINNYINHESNLFYQEDKYLYSLLIKYLFELYIIDDKINDTFTFNIWYMLNNKTNIKYEDYIYNKKIFNFIQKLSSNYKYNKNYFDIEIDNMKIDSISNNIILYFITETDINIINDNIIKANIYLDILSKYGIKSLHIIYPHQMEIQKIHYISTRKNLNYKLKNNKYISLNFWSKPNLKLNSFYSNLYTRYPNIRKYFYSNLIIQKNNIFGLLDEYKDEYLNCKLKNLNIVLEKINLILKKNNIDPKVEYIYVESILDLTDSHLAVETQNRAVETQNIAVETQNRALETQNIAVETHNRAVETQNIGVETQNIALETQNIALERQNIALETQNLALAVETIENDKINYIKQKTDSKSLYYLIFKLLKIF